MPEMSNIVKPKVQMPLLPLRRLWGGAYNRLVRDERPDQFWEVDAGISVIDLLSFEDLAPVLTDLNEQFLSVRGQRTNHRPPMAADPDLVVMLFFAVAVAGGEALRKVVGLLTEDVYKAIRAGVLRLVNKANEKDKSRPWNFGVEVGTHRFYFIGVTDDESFVRALAAIRPILEASPEGLLDGSKQPKGEAGGAGWWWQNDQGVWVPSMMMEAAMRGEFEERQKHR